MIGFSTATEVTTVIAAFAVILALLVLLRLVLRKGPPHWTQIRLGVYIERVPSAHWVEPEPDPYETPTLPGKPPTG